MAMGRGQPKLQLLRTLRVHKNNSWYKSAMNGTKTGACVQNAR